MERLDHDVLVIGAGPAGAAAAALLRRRQIDVSVVERQRFPRFMIGESLLPQCMDLLEEAGLLESVRARGYQRKNGAIFYHVDRREIFDFGEQFTAGWSYTHHVLRADFDKTIADAAAATGVPIHYEEDVVSVRSGGGRAEVVTRTATGDERIYRPRFIVDASGFGRVLPRLLGLDRPADFPERAALFSHLPDARRADYDYEKIWICVHPEQHDVWYWVIPFADATASIGVVGPPGVCNAELAETRYLELVHAEPNIARRFAGAAPRFAPRSIRGYASAVDRLWGDGFALLGNAGEFLDPIFSSGITIALKSASLAAPLIARQIAGEVVDWEREFEATLQIGIETFRTYVKAWYDGGFQRVIFHPRKSDAGGTRDMICSILAGYVWDTKNPYVLQPGRRLRALVKLCDLHS